LFISDYDEKVGVMSAGSFTAADIKREKTAEELVKKQGSGPD